MQPVWILGSGGHAKVVIETLRAMDAFEIVGILDDNPGRFGVAVQGVRVRGDASPGSIDRLAVKTAILAIGSNRDRAAAARRLDDRVSWATAVHPTAHLAPGVQIGEGTVVLAGAIVQPGSVIGRHAILNTACSVDHDGRIEDFVHVAPGSRLAGHVRIGEGSLLGIGCCVIPGRVIGPWSTIGAGSAVVSDVPAGATVKGVPAR